MLDEDDQKYTSGPMAGRTVREVALIMEEVRQLSVADGLDAVARAYRAVREDPERLREATGAEYLELRCKALADLFRDADAPARCSLEGRACFLDLFRGFRMLADRHPNPEARALYAAMGNQASAVLSGRAGVAVDVAAAMVGTREAAGTLKVWHEQVMRASQIARREGRGGARSQSGLSLVGRAAEVRAQLLVELLTQGMAELGVLIDALAP